MRADPACMLLAPGVPAGESAAAAYAAVAAAEVRPRPSPRPASRQTLLPHARHRGVKRHTLQHLPSALHCLLPAAGCAASSHAGRQACVPCDDTGDGHVTTVEMLDAPALRGLRRMPALACLHVYAHARACLPACVCACIRMHACVSAYGGGCGWWVHGCIPAWVVATAAPDGACCGRQRLESACCICQSCHQGGSLPAMPRPHPTTPAPSSLALCCRAWCGMDRR